MTNRERVLELIRSNPNGLSDTQIREQTGINPHQQVNQICRDLAAAGLIVRRPGRPIINLPAGSPADDSQPSHHDAPAIEPKKRSVRRNHGVPGGSAAGVPCLPIKKTLFVIPCSKGKQKGGRPETAIAPSVLNSLPRGLSDELTACRAKVAKETKIDESALMPAAERYKKGWLYRAAEDALDTLAEAGAHIVIVSGGYGLVHHREPIGSYDRKFRNSMWPDALVGRCIAAYASAIRATHIVGLLSKTHYAKAFPKTKSPWREIEEVEQVLLGVPEKGPQIPVLRAQGEALLHLSRDHRLPPGWKSSDGIGVNVERLK